jgi:superfamily I DNA/RNA helicase
MTSSQNSEEKPLDDEQKAAAEATEPAIAVLAGPGSGKTRTLSYRARFLLQNDKAASGLLLTFTNKAAAEMKARALGVSAVPGRRISASTFHTFCVDVIRSHGDLVSLPKEFEIIDQDEAREIAVDVAGPQQGRSLLNQFSEVRLRRKPVPAWLKHFAKEFQSRKVAEATLDFDDLVVGVADLFEARGDVANAYSAKYRHILVDEFQDTNPVQAAIIRALVAKAKTVSIFADDDQAIFGFAGAEAANIGRFVKTSAARTFPLTTNYRSGANIVAVANKLIKADPTTSGREMKPHRAGGMVRARSFVTPDEEAKTIIDEIDAAIKKGAAPSSIALLARRGKRLDELVAELRRRGIPVSDWRGETHTPEERRIFAAGLATVRGTLNKRQRRRLCELMHVPLFDDPATAAFFEAHQSDPFIKRLKAARDLAFAAAAPHEVAEGVRKAIATKDDAIGKRLESLVHAVEQFEKFDANFTLEHLFSELALGSVGRPPAEGGGVKVASLHRTKGLQWKTVYLIGLEDGQLPDFRATTSAGISEERRLCFVGVSRAEDQLCITWCRSVGGYAQSASRFFAEMGIKAP